MTFSGLAAVRASQRLFARAESFAKDFTDGPGLPAWTQAPTPLSDIDPFAAIPNPDQQAIEERSAEKVEKKTSPLVGEVDNLSARSPHSRNQQTRITEHPLPNPSSSKSRDHLLGSRPQETSSLENLKNLPLSRSKPTAPDLSASAQPSIAEAIPTHIEKTKRDELKQALKRAFSPTSNFGNAANERKAGKSATAKNSTRTSQQKLTSQSSSMLDETKQINQANHVDNVSQETLSANQNPLSNLANDLFSRVDYPGKNHTPPKAHVDASTTADQLSHLQQPPASTASTPSTTDRSQPGPKPPWIKSFPLQQEHAEIAAQQTSSSATLPRSAFPRRNEAETDWCAEDLADIVNDQLVDQARRQGVDL